MNQACCTDRRAQRLGKNPFWGAPALLSPQTPLPPPVSSIISRGPPGDRGVGRRLPRMTARTNINKRPQTRPFIYTLVYYFIASSTATATATVAPTIGLLPMPIRPIISMGIFDCFWFCCRSSWNIRDGFLIRLYERPPPHCNKRGRIAPACTVYQLISL